MDPFIPSPTLHGMIARRVDAFLEKQFAHHRWHMVDFILKLSKIG
jgi:hypothetical protein